MRFLLRVPGLLRFCPGSCQRCLLRLLPQLRPVQPTQAEANDKRILTKARLKRSTSEQGMVANDPCLNHHTPNTSKLLSMKQETGFSHITAQKVSFKIGSKSQGE